MKRSQAYPSTYLTQEDVRAEPIRATIKDVRTETVGKGEDSDEKPVIHFRENIKTFVLNSTNWQTIEDAYGAESDDWNGKTVELYHDPNVMFGKDRKGGVRVRIPASTYTPPAPGFAAPKPSCYPMEQAVADAVKAGKTKEDFVAALKGAGLAGYSETRDASVAMSIISAWQAAKDDEDNTIPF